MARDGRILGWWRFTGLFRRLRACLRRRSSARREPACRGRIERNQAGPGRSDAAGSATTPADAISTHLGNVYRSAFMLVFLASAFAVLAGLAGVFWWHDTTAKALFVVLELGFIGVVLRLTQIGRRRAWHRRWLETRRLAELLRVAAALAPAGGGPPIAPGERAGRRRRLDRMVCAFVPARSARAGRDGRPGSPAGNGGRLLGRPDRRTDPLPPGEHNQAACASPRTGPDRHDAVLGDIRDRRGVRGVGGILQGRAMASASSISSTAGSMKSSIAFTKHSNTG